MKFILSGTVLTFSFIFTPLLTLGHNHSVRVKEKALAQQRPAPQAFDYGLLPQFNGLKIPSPVKVTTSPAKNLKPTAKITWENPFMDSGSPEQSQKLNLANGSGTRGGGSGVIRKAAQGSSEVLVLDLFRTSALLTHSPLLKNFAETGFVALLGQIDSTLISLNQKPYVSTSRVGEMREASVEEASEQILTEVMSRLEKIFPLLGVRLRRVHQEFPFFQWTATSVELPLIKDFGPQLSLKENEQQVQIAYRRANYVIYNQHYYHLMDAIQRAALKLHELVYAISGFSESENIQIFVQLAMSAALTHSQGKAFAESLIHGLHLSYLLKSNLELPSGVELNNFQTPSKDIECGIIQKLSIETNPFKVEIQIGLDRNYPHLTHQSFIFKNYDNDIVKLLQGIPKFTEQKILNVESEEAQLLLESLYNLKFYFSVQFPLYHFPLQSQASDILCIDQTDSLRSLSSGLFYRETANKKELSDSELEAGYYQTYETYLKDPSSLNTANLETYKKLLRELKTTTEEMEENPFLSKLSGLMDTKALSVQSVIFKKN